MIEFTPPYDADTRLALSERALADAEFIRSGAQFDQMGRLVLSQPQLARIQLESPFSLPQTQEVVPSLVLDAWMGSKVTDATVLSTRTTNCLLRQGIFTLRDILVVGSDGISDIRNMGYKSVDEITDMMNDAPQYQPWLDVPSLVQLPRYIDDPRVAPGLVLYNFTLNRRQTQHKSNPTEMRVGELSQTDESELLSRMNRYGNTGNGAAAVVIQAARSFIKQFEAANAPK